MKSFNLIFTALTIFGSSAHAGNNYLGKADDRAVVISISPDKLSYSSGGKAKFNGTINVTGKKSYDWGNFWDWLFGNKKKGLLEEFQKEGIEVTGSFPSSAIDVSSSLKLESNGDDEIKFSFESQPIVAGDLNQLSLRVYNNSNDKAKLKLYASIQAKLERRLAALKDLKKYYQNNRALKEVIAVIERKIDNLTDLSEKIQDRINSDDNLIAESIRPIQVDNLTGSLNRSMTSINGFRFSAYADNGVPFEGLPNRILAKVSKIGNQDNDDDYYKNFGKYGYVSELYKDGNLIKSQTLDLKTAVAVIDFPIISLSSLDQNKFELMLYRTEKGKKKSRIGTMVHYVNVLSDKVKPNWLGSSLPNLDVHYVQSLPSISLVVNDSFGRINASSFSAKIDGKMTSGQLVSFDLTSGLLVNKDLDGSQYSWTGSFPNLSEGEYDLSALVLDYSKNSAQPNPYKTKIIVDRSSPLISFGNLPGVEVSSANFSLSINISDKSPVDSKIFLNGIEVLSSNLFNFQAQLTLIPGENKIKIVGIDKAGNTAEAQASIIFDVTPPVLTQVLPEVQSKYYTNILPLSVPFKITSNEKLSKAFVNGNVIAVASDLISFSGIVSVSNAGSQTISISAKDLAGNESSIGSSYEIIYDNQSPSINLTYSSESITNAPSIPLNVVVSDSSPVWSKVIVNDLVIFETQAKNFSIPFELNKEGKNTFKISATDSAGNQAISQIVEVTRDTTPPQLVTLAPTNNTIVDRMVFQINGSANESLSAANADGTVLSVNDKNFLGQYISNKIGPQTIHLSFVDKVGNTTSLDLNIDIQDILLVPNLISVIPDSDNVHMWVVGAPSAARPGAQISVSAAIFGNSGETVVGSNGSFNVRLNKFSQARIKAEDKRTNETAEASVTFNSTTSLAGTVKDVNGVPLPNVTVGFAGAGVSVVTNANGNFLFVDPPTGDQILIVNGSTVLPSSSGEQRKFYSTKVAINIGLGQANQLGEPVYLTPLLLDGSETKIVNNAGANVTSSHAPGVELVIPSAATTFPDGSHTGAINVMTIDASRATTTVPQNFIPTNVVALEPSGTQFSKPVAISLPNDNDLPPKTPMVFFSMNSSKGTWEIDGQGAVSDDGKSVKTNSNSGISHFSLIYAVPLSPVIATLKNPNLLGISTTQGGLETSISLPNFKILEGNVNPTLNYKSGWANPTAVVSNSFSIPSNLTTNTGSGSGETKSVYDVLKKRCTTETHNYYFIYWDETSCETYWQEWWSKVSYQFNWVSSNLWVPDSITSQFFVGSIASDQVSFSSGVDNQITQIPGMKITNAAATQILQQSGLPETSIMSYAVPLKDPANGEYMASGIHPSLARYQVKLRNLTITTSTTNAKENVGVSTAPGVTLGSRTIQYDPETSVQSQMLEYLPEDLHANILVQNKTKSKAGRGWEIGGVQRIYNPTNTTIMVEQGDGSVATYALNSVMNTLYDAASSGFDLSHGVDLTNWPNAVAARVDANKNSFLTQVNLSSGVLTDLNQIPTNTGKLSSQGYSQCATTLKCDDVSCYNQYSGHFSSTQYSFKSKSTLGGLARNSNGSYFLVDSLQHAIYSNGGTQKILGLTQTVDAAVSRQIRDYELYIEYFNGQSNTVNETCRNLFGVDCGSAEVQPTVYDCAAANIVRTCTTSSGLSQVITCNYTHNPQYMFTPSIGSIGLAGAGASGLNSPTFALGAPNGRLIVADTGNNRVVSVDPVTGALSLVAGNGQNTDSGDGGVAVSAGIFHPRGLVFDQQGNLYISSENGYIRKVDTAGVISTIAGLPLSKGGVVADQAAALSLALSNPQGMVFDQNYEKLYIADTNNNRVIGVDLASGIANKIAGTGQCTIDAVEGNPALFSSLCSPTVLGMDVANNLLIVDSGHNKIRRVTFSSYAGGALAYVPSVQDLSRVFKNSDGTWTRQYRNGSYDSFDVDGFQTFSTDKLGRVTQYFYDSDHNLIKIKYPNGQNMNYSYSGGYLSAVSDPAGRVTSFNYAGGNLTSVNFPGSHSKVFQYDPNGQLISEVNEENKKTIYEYNEWGRLRKVTDAAGSSQIINDIASQTIANNFSDGSLGASSGMGFGDGKVATTITDGNDVTTEMTQDHMGFISAVKDALGNVTVVTRDFMGRPISIKKADGNVVTLTYDPATGDLLSVKDIGTGVVTSWTYDSYGHLLSETDGRGKITQYTYDSNSGLLKEVHSADGILLSIEYNSMGLITKQTLTNGSVSESSMYIYDTLGRVSQIVDSGGHTKDIVCDLAGNQNQIITTSNGGDVLVKSLKYDDFNRIIEVKTPKNEITKYSYLGTSQLSEIVDPKGKLQKFTYDNVGRLVQKVSDAGGVLSYGYDGNGNKVSESDSNGNSKTLKYDLLNRLVKVISTDDVVDLQYDAVGNLRSAANKYSQINFGVDSLGRITYSSMSGIGEASAYPVVPLNYTYDGVGNRLSLSSAVLNMVYNLNSSNRISRIQNSNGEVFNFDYDELRRIKQLTRPGSGNKTLYGYNSSGLISQITHYGNGSIRDYTSIGYDRRNLINSKSGLTGTFQYGLDENGQVVSMANTTSGASENFSYDELGNRTNDGISSYSYNASSQKIMDDGTYTYQYDNNGNTTGKIAKDISKQSYKMSYNSNNQLIKVQILKGSLGNIVLEASYLYDVLGRRIIRNIKDFENQADVTKSFIRMYLYDNDRILAEYNGDGALLMSLTQAPSGADSLLSANVAAAGVAAKISKYSGTFYFLQDHAGSIAAIADSNGNILQKYEYKVFGEINSIKDSSGNDISADLTFNSDFTFIGRELDRETGFMYLRARYYDPRLGRFVQNDPYAGNIASPISVINRYTYANNNPIKYADPSGLDPVTTITAPIGGGYSPGSGADTGAYHPGNGAPIGNSTNTTITTIGSAMPPPPTADQRSRDALQWLNANNPEVTAGVNPVIINSGSMITKATTALKAVYDYIGYKDEIDVSNGAALGRYIFIDFNELNDTETVGLIAHELMHAQAGFWRTVFGSEKDHDKIYNKQSQIQNNFSNRTVVPKGNK